MLVGLPDSCKVSLALEYLRK